MRKSDYTLPKFAWANADVRFFEMERLWHDGLRRLIITREGKVTIR